MKITTTILLFIAGITSTWGMASSTTFSFNKTSVCSASKTVFNHPSKSSLEANAGLDTAICLGESLILRGGSNVSDVDYEWLSLSGTTLSRSQNYSISPSLSTYYVLKIVNTLGNIDTDTVFIKVNDRPNVTLTVSTPDTICNQVLPTFKAKGANSYIWSSFPSIASSALSSRTGDSVVLYTILLAAPKYTFTVEGTDVNGCKNTAQKTLVIIPLPSVTITPIRDTLCSTDQAIKLTVAPDNIGRFYVEDTLGRSIQNVINNSMFDPSKTGVGKFTIYYEVINENGCKSNPAIEINVKSCRVCTTPDSTKQYIKSCDPSTVGILTKNLKNKFGCDSIVVINTTLVQSDTTYSFSTSCNPADTGTIERKLKNTLGCDSLILLRTSLIKSDTTRLNNTSCDPSVSGVSTKYLKNKYGCDSIVTTLTTWVESDTTYLFSTSCNPRDTGIFKNILTNFTGCDSLIISTIGLSRADTIRLNATSCDSSKSGISTKYLKNKLGCDSIVITLTAFIKPDTTYSFSTSCNPTQVGRSINRYISSKGCDSLVITDVRLVPSNIDITLKLQKNISCHQKSDGSIGVHSLAGGTPQYRLLWNTGDTSSVITQLKAGIYRLTVTDAVGCPKVDSFNLVEPEPLTLEAKGVQAACAGDLWGSIRLNSVSGGTPPYQFFVNEQSQTFKTLPLVLNNIRIGQYSLKISDTNNCFQDTAISVNDGRNLIVDLGSDLTIDLGDSIDVNVVSNYPAKTIKWSPELDLKCPNCVSNIVNPIKTTTYTISITDSLGCQASDRITVNVDKKRRVFIPDSFSPNADGTNDILMIYAGKGVKIIKKFQIFNRWGSRVFDAQEFPPNDVEYGWDGTFREVQLQPDIYIYFAIIDFIDGKTETMQGHINLVR